MQVEPSILTVLRTQFRFPWRMFSALGIALLAQQSFEPPRLEPWPGLVGYGLALILATWAISKGEIRLPAISRPPAAPVDDGEVSLLPLLVGMVLFAAAFLLFSDNQFTWVNVLLWLACLAVFAWAFAPGKGSLWARLPGREFFKRHWSFYLSNRVILLGLLVFVVVFFRAYRLDSVPPEMYSDHAEKLLDIATILDGKYPIFFVRNTGREPLQMYLTAAVSVVFGTGLTFMSMKIATLLAGLLTIPYVYRLGVEFGGERTGWLAAFFAGISYWLNVITRVSLRYTFYPFLLAPLLYYLIRGLRRGSRADAIRAGIFLGIGLHGYSAYRIVPLLVLFLVGLYLLHTRSALRRWQAAWHTMIIGIFSLIVFLPLLRFIFDSQANFNIFFYRSLTRLTSLETDLPGPAWQVFLRETGQALAIFWWDNGDIWVHAVRLRPALDVVMAVLLALGLLFVGFRYIRRRSWEDLALPVSLVVLLLPSALSIAFPGENPSLNRSGAAMVPAAVLIGFALHTLATSLEKGFSGRLGKVLSAGLVSAALIGSAASNYDLVFNQYATHYRTYILNTSEVGSAVRQMTAVVGSPLQVWVVPYPHWVDTRLVGIEAGFPRRDYALWRHDIFRTQLVPGAKAYIVHWEDVETLNELSRLFPQSVQTPYTSQFGRDFWVVFVPPG